MKQLLAIGITALVGLFLFSGCDDAQNDDVALRVAVFTYAFEHDTETGENRSAWIFAIESDLYHEDVARALTSYPLVKGKVKIEDRDSVHRIDLNSGKQFVYWSVKISRKSTGHIWAEVSCVKGGLNGYGQILILKKKSGHWSVVSSIPSWVS